MIVFRLCRAKYQRDLSGKGAESSGGRWNSKGVPVVYCSASRALCTAEIAVHTPLGILPQDYRLVEIDIPDGSAYTLRKNQLPTDWAAIPPVSATKAVGDQFVLEGKHLVLKVPSVVVPGDYNYLLNPRHERFKEIKINEITSFSFDRRLFA